MQWLDPLTIQTDTPVQYSFAVCFCGGEIAFVYLREILTVSVVFFPIFKSKILSKFNTVSE